MAGKAAKLSAALGRVGAVVFSPGDVELVSGGPGMRRRFLDIVLSLNCPGYLEALQEYRRWLGQRNAALRSGGGERGGSAWIGAWDAGLVDAGARVMQIRSDWVAEWAETFAGHYRAIAGDADAATLSYRPQIGLPGDSSTDAASLRAHFATRLAESLTHDLRRGVTGTGPHRDELLLGSADSVRPLRHFGSGGQRRTAALALRLNRSRHSSSSARRSPPPSGGRRLCRA